jgi:hypothetical protein
MSKLLIIVILSLILLLCLIYYNFNQYEYFTQFNKNILINTTELGPNKTIGEIINIPYIDLDKLNTDIITNLTLLDARITGYEILNMSDGKLKYRLRTGTTYKQIDLSSNEYDKIKTSVTFMFKDNEKMLKDPSNIYVAYPHKLPKDFISSTNIKTIPIDKLEFTITNIGDLINKLGIDCTKDKSCTGFYIALNTKNELIIGNIDIPINVSMLRDYPYTMNGDIIASLLCVKQTPDQIKMANTLVGSCAKITLKSKDIGKDCFGQLWAENKCNNPIPEYNDTFKALSYEELVTELKDSNCYTNPTWKRQMKDLEEKKEENNIVNKLSNFINIFK